MNRDSDCIFCKIVENELPGFRVFENEHTVAFMDINPVANGHVLVVPKEHWANLYEMPDVQFGYTSATVRRVATAVNQFLNPDGISIIQANGKGAAQSVLHFHIHIVPRTFGDELKINWELKSGKMDEIEAAAKSIQRKLTELGFA